MNRNGQVDNFSKLIKGKHGFYNGGKLKNLKSYFWPEKLTNIGPEKRSWVNCSMHKQVVLHVYSSMFNQG